MTRRAFRVGDRVESRIKTVAGLFGAGPRRGVITEALPLDFPSRRRVGPVRVRWDGGTTQLCERRDLRRLD